MVHQTPMHPKAVGRGWKKENKPRPKRFNRHQSNNFKRVGTSWRKPRGIDSRVRRRWHGTKRMPNIGYRTAKRDRFRRRNDGKYRFYVNSPGDLKMVMMYNDSYIAELSHTMSAKKRPRAVKLARQMGIRVVNRFARLQTADQE